MYSIGFSNESIVLGKIGYKSKTRIECLPLVLLSGVQELSCAALVQDKSCIPIETAAQRKRSGTGCKSISAQGVQDLSCVALVQDKSCIPIETAAQRKRSGTGCKPIPAQIVNLFPHNIFGTNL